MRLYGLLLGVLAVWRVTHFLHAEDGPWSLSASLRRRAGDGFWGALLDCFLCLSVWVSLPFAWAIGQTWEERLLLWPALSGGASLAQRLAGGGGASPAPAVYFEEPPRKGEPDHVVLRQEPAGADGVETGRKPELPGP